MTGSAARTHLLDGNVLVALVVPEHVHHLPARSWFRGAPSFATSPTVQGTLLRLLLRSGSGITQARQVLASVVAHARHEQWLDDLSYSDVELVHVIGHRQVTDAYLAQLARSRGGLVATFDGAFAQVAPDVAVLLPR
ncbi:hypothetical protein SAMN05661080_00059 [Modestobacter sp. DSM 44400]|uniref:TA system VapC family ribonuclease toxin n=1 Tax=Modestobacter sp. DSM 44400 TaxID=1550230 RepID=UPI000898B3AD|nr:TA system VapC family ribonuclease toxin [Modestobacter sp. DSM 44400]SDX47516.1 hypothetical protein SAMN05661080_00059 [Modestobacter sp. DSM 44400]